MEQVKLAYIISPYDDLFEVGELCLRQRLQSFGVLVGRANWTQSVNDGTLVKTHVGWVWACKTNEGAAILVQILIPLTLKDIH